MKTKSILLHLSRLLLFGHLIMLAQVTNSHATADRLNIMYIENTISSLPKGLVLINEKVLSTTGLLVDSEFNYGSAFVQMDPCGCDIALLQSFALIETLYLAGLLICPVTGPGIFTCWGVATAGKASAMALAVYHHDGCRDLCDQLQEN